MPASETKSVRCRRNFVAVRPVQQGDRRSISIVAAVTRDCGAMRASLPACFRNRGASLLLCFDDAPAVMILSRPLTRNLFQFCDNPVRLFASFHHAAVPHT